jgi:hypothetical protein
MFHLISLDFSGHLAADCDWLSVGSPISSSLAAPLQPPSSQAPPSEAHSAPAYALCDKATIANKAPQIIEICISFDFSKLIAFHQDLGRKLFFYFLYNL